MQRKQISLKLNNMEVKFKSDEEMIEKTPNRFFNCAITDNELNQMEKWLQICLSCVDNKMDALSEAELNNIEENSDLIFPPPLKLLFSSIGNNERFFVPSFSKNMNFKFLYPNQLYIQKNIEIHDYYSGKIWYKSDILIYSTTIKRNSPVYGIDYKRGWALSCYKKKWYWQKDNRPIHKELIVALVCILISHKKNVIRSKLKGLNSFNAHKAAQEKFRGYIELMLDFQHYGHSLFYNIEKGCLAWFREGSATPDIFMGSDNQTFIKDFVTTFDLAKAKHIKRNGIML